MTIPGSPWIESTRIVRSTERHVQIAIIILYLITLAMLGIYGFHRARPATASVATTDW